jgi:hypothetical protein
MTNLPIANRMFSSTMATFRRWAVIIGAFVLAQAYDYDVVVYESTPGGIMTAVACKLP